MFHISLYCKHCQVLVFLSGNLGLAYMVSSHGGISVRSQFHSTIITDKCFIELQTKLKASIYSILEIYTARADRVVLFLCDIDVAKCYENMPIEIFSKI